MSILDKIFSPVNKYRGTIEEINALEKGVVMLSDHQLKEKSALLKKNIREENLSVDEHLNEAFALVRETAKRVLKQRHYDVQLIGGIVLSKGNIAEMATGEGKTLAATAPAYLHGLTGKGVHIITVNDYLAQRDAVWMGQIYDFLGLSVSCIVHDQAFIYDSQYNSSNRNDVEFGQHESASSQGESALLDKERDTTGSFRVQKEYLRPISRKDAYLADIVYGTNQEFGFDYLRDNLAYSSAQQVQRKPYYAIIDEVDSILIDEARTPLIISAPDTQAAEYYKMFARLVLSLDKEKDYILDEKARVVQITDEGIGKVEKLLSIDNLYDSTNLRLVHYLEESLKAKALFSKDRHYVVKNGEIIIVDEFTGRLMPGRRYSGGLHQAIEAKEGVAVQDEQKTFAQITIQNYFRLYERISGMTGTAATSSEEFNKVYGLDVVIIPTNKPSVRNDHSDYIFKSKEAKYRAVVKEVKERSQKGQPVLLGTTSIDENQLLSSYFSNAGITHEVLNAKNHEREGEIIAQAGRTGAVTLATNMAGRGVDIILGGNPPSIEAGQKIKDFGGLYVIGTQKNEARRVDNQLRGRSGRQGDPGETQFFLSLEDDLLRIFGGDKIKSLMTSLKLPEDQPIESGIVGKVVNEAQKKVEGINFDIRKHLLEYDTVLNKQRQTVYKRRQNVMDGVESGKTEEILKEIVSNNLVRVVAQMQAMNVEGSQEKESPLLNYLLGVKLINNKEDLSSEDTENILQGQLPDKIIQKIEEASKDIQTGLRILASIDIYWTNHLENLEALMEAVRMRAYGQKDPLVEYKRESFDMFRGLIANSEDWVVANVFQQTRINTDKTVRIDTDNNPYKSVSNNQYESASNKSAKVGRNDPCPCGAINPQTGQRYKYKHCGLINASYHKSK
jgi:preprotein translocase subunit SecA